MFTEPVKKHIVATTMWTIGNFARKQAFVFDQDLRAEELLRTMLRAGLSLDGDNDLMDDALVAMKDLTI